MFSCVLNVWIGGEDLYQRDYELPFAPFIGLILTDDDLSHKSPGQGWTVSAVSWDGEAFELLLDDWDNAGDLGPEWHATGTKLSSTGIKPVSSTGMNPALDIGIKSLKPGITRVQSCSWSGEGQSLGTSGSTPVEDEKAISTLLQLALTQHNFRVILAASGEEALDLYRQRSEEIDVVLTDVQLPGVDGSQTLDASQQINPAVCCCFMSGATGKYDGEGLRKQGAAFIAKPFSVKDLADLLRSLLPPGTDLRDSLKEVRTEPEPPSP
jgi:CheY-like chemotaxis protein